jgi:anti-sigma B factor antagonist
MKIQQQSDALRIGDIKELGASSAQVFKDEVRAALPDPLHAIEVDLSQTAFVDSCGLGALIAVYKTASGRNGGVSFRLINPTPPVQQILELTRMHRIFEIVRR